ncbi:MAG: AI-2E family transporter [Treponema sp.]|jgi:predicted PurR-regulated permease PerM|nr:AI-2E family transporter [Treponema sp.]
MKDVFRTFNSGRANFFLVAFISCIIAGTVLKLTASIILPFTIALLLAMVMYPLVLGLDKFHIPRIFSILLSVAFIIAGLYVLGMVLFTSGRTILSLYPRYENRLTEIYVWAARFFEFSYDEDLSFWQNLWSQLGIRTIIRTFTLSFSNFFLKFMQNALLVVLFMSFLMLEASQFSEKLELAFEKRAGQFKRMGADIIRQVTRYLTAKFLISLVTGLVVAIGLRLAGLEFAVVWGVIQFVLNFIPSLGSIAAGVAASLFALLQFWPDPGPVILVILIMLGANMIIGNILDPKIIGDNVGISPLVVLVSLGIWGWLWGFIGMILAVPMMVSIKIICENFSFLEPISILLSSRKAVQAKKAEQAESAG